MTKTFHDLGVHEALCDALADQGITHPFPIQELTLPLALDGNDLIGQARTGTGKTLAFGLPLLQRIDPAKQATQALVIAPTRELANQVHEDLAIGKTLGLTSICVYGGVPYEEQIEALQGGVHVVVGTPGRLLDHLNRRNLDLANVTQLVLDEADEMLDMGFLPDVERLIEACGGEDRHTMLFSATMPTAIVRLARRYMQHPTFTRADHEEKNTAPLVTQHFFQVHRMDKPRVLARILQSPERGGVYVFVRTKHMADRLVNELEDLGTPAVPIHGDLRQSSREHNLDRFRSGKATVLVATEVAARGLDVSGVTHVVNYDCPDDEKMYLHRIGRTARAGEAGAAITFAEFNEADRLNVIRKAVGATDTEVLPIFSTSPELAEMFDLPEAKPWDAMVKVKVDEEQEHQRRRRESRGSKGGARPGRSDGRSKNTREREGRGDRHDARERADRQAGTKGQDRSGGGKGGDGKGGDGKGGGGKDTATGSGSGRSAQQRSSTQRSSDERTRSRAGGATRSSEGTSQRAETGSSERRDTGQERVRTRTRTRTRGEGDDGGTAGRERSEGKAGSSEGGQRVRARPDRDATGDEAKGGRDQAKGGRDRAKGGRGQDSNDEPRQDGGTDGRREAGRDKDREPRSRGEQGGRSGAGSSGGGRSRSGSASAGRSNGSDGGGGRNNRGGSRSGGGRSGGGRSGGRSGGNRSDDRSGGKRSAGGRDADRDPKVSVARPGAEARGEGHPQLARRVRVEKLP